MENPEQPTPTPSHTPQLNEGKLLQYRAQLRLEQNLPLGFAGGVAAALVGGLVWAIITVATGYQIGWIAMGVGFIVGYSVRYLGKGMDPIFGIMGGALALFGCLLGNFFSLIGITANQEGMPYLDLLSNIDYSLIPEIMIDTFSPMDLLFYGIAAYEGYKFSFRQITEQEIAANAMK